MCTIFLAHQVNPKYKLIMLSNRDEFYERRTAQASWWENGKIFGGRDLKDLGTWLGITRDGRISTLTNFREVPGNQEPLQSRGMIVSQYLESHVSAPKYLEDLKNNKNQYNGFNLLCGTVDQIFYLTNKKSDIIPLSQGVHGLSNGYLNEPWFKVERGRDAFGKLVKSPNVNIEDAFALMLDKTQKSLGPWPDTGFGEELERFLSSLFISGDNYGTRSTTLLLVDRQNRVYFEERTYVPHEDRISEEFEIYV
jgi:uncharacterized protein with NRDE domain